MSVTYIVREPDGFEHSRTSRGHRLPQYFHAVVRWPQARKAGVSYHSTLQLAQAALAEAFKPLAKNSYTVEQYPERVGQPTYPDAKIYPVEAVVK